MENEPQQTGEREAPLTEQMEQALQELLNRFQIEPGWDAVIVGDGSGSRSDRPCGWATLVFLPGRGASQLMQGGANPGTNNFAETMAYVHALTWLEIQLPAGRFHRIHVFTDSQYCVTQGQKPTTDPSRNAVLWAAIDGLRRRGFTLYWHHIDRESNFLNHLADRLSKEARHMITDEA